MLMPPRFLQLLKAVAPFLLTIWLLGRFVSYQSAYGGVIRQFKDERELFVSDFLQHEIDGAFDGRGISELCSSRQWTPGLILSCQPVPGGIGQVKNAHLNCVRLAIEMGGE